MNIKSLVIALEIGASLPMLSETTHSLDSGPVAD